MRQIILATLATLVLATGTQLSANDVQVIYSNGYLRLDGDADDNTVKISQKAKSGNSTILFLEGRNGTTIEGVTLKHLVAVNLDWIDLNFDQGGSNSVRVFDVRSDQPNSIFIFSGGGSSRLQFQDCEFDHFDVTGTTYVDVEYCTIDEHFQIYGTQYDEWVRVKDSYINGDGLIVTGDGKDHVQIEDVIWYGDVKIVSGYNQYKLDDYTDMDTVEIFGMFVYDLEIRMGDSCDWLEMANGDVEFWAQGVVDIHGGNSLDCMQLNRLPTEFRIDWMFNGRHTHYERMNFIWESVEYAFGTR